MIIHFTLNGAPQELTVNPGENVQKLLFNMGMHSVRNSDDGFGFAGSDAIIFNGNIVNASLLIAAQLEKADIRTAESLGKWNELSLLVLPYSPHHPVVRYAARMGAASRRP